MLQPPLRSPLRRLSGLRLCRAVLCAAGVSLALPTAYAQSGQALPLTSALPELASGEWGWRIEQPAASWVRGAVNRDAAGGGAAGVLYPGGHALVALAAILTHAAINSAVRDAEDKKLREDADKVLDPLRDVLSQVTTETLTQGLEQHAQGSALLKGQTKDEAARRWTIEMVPTLTLAQSARAWTLDAQINVWNEPKASTPHAVRVVRVISDPLTVEQPHEYWREDGGAHLRRVIAGLMAEALEVSLADRLPTASVAQRTVRFQDGIDERVERAAVLGKACGRIQFRNLREWLVSAPLPGGEGADASEAQCLAAKRKFQ